MSKREGGVATTPPSPKQAEESKGTKPPTATPVYNTCSDSHRTPHKTGKVLSYPQERRNMRKKLKDKIELLDKYPAAVRDTIMEAHSDTEMVDVLGTVASVQRRVAEQRRLAQAEVAPTAAEHELRGEMHSMEVRRSARRTYNTPALMKLMQDNGHTLLDLLAHDVLRITWRWTELKNFAERRGIALHIEAHDVVEMGDPEGEHIGEIWQDGSVTYR